MVLRCTRCASARSARHLAEGGSEMRTLIHLGTVSSCTLVLIALAACVPPAPEPIAPTQLHVTHTPAEVVQTATRELAAAGFEVSVSDAAGGTVVAKRVRAPDEQGEDVKCKYAHGSIAGKGAEATLTTNVTARPASGGSDVQISSFVRTDFSRLPGIFANQPANDKDCVSSGAIEKKIADALK